jgi:hypothetical protein
MFRVCCATALKKTSGAEECACSVRKMGFRAPDDIEADFIRELDLIQGLHSAVPL